MCSISATSDLSSVDRRVVAEDFQRQLHPRQRRAQIVRHAGQHLGALPDLALDAVAHRQKGDRRLADLDRTLDLEKRHVPALAETVGRRRQPAQRLDLVAQKQQSPPPSSTSDEPTIHMIKM